MLTNRLSFVSSLRKFVNYHGFKEKTKDYYPDTGTRGFKGGKGEKLAREPQVYCLKGGLFYLLNTDKIISWYYINSQLLEQTLTYRLYRLTYRPKESNQTIWVVVQMSSLLLIKIPRNSR